MQLVFATPAERVAVETLTRVQPLLDELEGGVLLIGGLMARLVVERSGVELPIRPTADVDLGVTRKDPVRLYGSVARVGPRLRELGFESGADAAHGTYRFVGVDQPELIVDVLSVPNERRDTTPHLEPGIEAIEAPGLSYAFAQGVDVAHVRFADAEGAVLGDVRVPLPRPDAAFVLKAALVGRRSHPPVLAADTADAVSLAAVVLGSEPSLDRLDRAKSTSELAACRRFVAACADAESAHARRVADGLGFDRSQRVTYATWAADIMEQLRARLDWPPA